MKKLYTLFLTAFIFSFVSAQQSILLMTETFENGTNSFDFNTGGVGTNSGNNQWVVNNVYSGAPLYPNTPSEDSTVSGTINGAPYSHYLHIHDAASGIGNANWNTNTQSDRFTFIGSPFCTLGMNNVIFTFFWTCQGDTNAYGEVYYRIDGGPWTQTGLPKYNHQSKWKYESISNPAFNNVQNLQLGFRWVNPASGVISNTSFGIDDIIAVGTYQNVTNPVNVSINLIYPLTVCQGDFLTIGYSLSAPLCDGTYRIQMSDATGSFANPVDGGVFSVFAPDTNGYIGFQTPTNVQGNCFKIRINRISPEPQIVGQASVCFTIQNCPETIVTTGAPVMNDNDTTCIQSVIDVKFNSFGVFGPGNPNPNNIYRVQLSDSSGSFTTPYQLGTLPSDATFSGNPGTVSGIIPANVPPGCGYYIRVISTNPPVTGSPIGPFCLTQCDELTNNTQDIHVCLNGSVAYPTDTSVHQDANLNITIHRWNNNAQYDTCNDWRIELLSMMDFSLVNIGSLGVFHDSTGGDFVISFPPFAQQLIAMGIQPGAYYLRIVSDCSNETWNETGSVVRITIGAPDTLRPTILLDDTVECNLGLVSLYVSPFNHPPSDYEWTANGINNGLPFTWQYNPLLVDFTGAPLNDYIFYVREINYGCVGAYSDRATLTIIGSPSVSISGDTTVCLGDTVTYNVGYLKETYYNWDAPPGVAVFDEANSQVTMIFDTLGTFTISNFSLNKCGGDSGSYTVHVITPYSVNAGPDTTLCYGNPLAITAVAKPVQKLFSTTDVTTTQGYQGAMFNLIAHGDVVIDSFAVKYLTTPQLVQQEIWGKTGSYRTFEQSAGSWNQIGAYNNFTAKPPSQFTVIPIPVNQPIASGDTFGFYITTNNPTAVNMEYSPGVGTTQGVVYKTDGVIDFVQGTINAYQFGAFIGPRVLNVHIYYSTKAGLHYLWNTGDTSATIQFSTQPSGLYSVIVYDSSGCKSSDSLHVTVKPSPLVNAGTDTLLCPGETYQLHASTETQNYSWNPTTGLSDTTLNPFFTNTTTSQFELSSLGLNGCTGRDTVFITIKPSPDINAGPDTAVCNGLSYIIPATSSTQNFHWMPADGLDNPDVLNPVFNGNHTSTYILMATDTVTGCTRSDTVTIGVGVNPTLNVGPDHDVCDNESYTMVAVSNGKIFTWIPSSGLSDSTILNPVFNGNGTDSVEYILIASDSAGCKTIDSVKLRTISCYLKVPQAFTPNGDGENDHFTVFGSMSEYEIKIFNRWGEMVYDSKDVSELNDLSKGWDGTYKGKPQELGAFVYYISGKDASGKTIQKKGNLTLIR